MADYKYICKADCPELDLNNESHCKCNDLNQWYEYHPDGCLVGNNEKWEEFQMINDSRGGKYEERD